MKLNIDSSANPWRAARKNSIYLVLATLWSDQQKKDIVKVARNLWWRAQIRLWGFIVMWIGVFGIAISIAREKAFPWISLTITVCAAVGFIYCLLKDIGGGEDSDIMVCREFQQNLRRFRLTLSSMDVHETWLQMMEGGANPTILRAMCIQGMTGLVRSILQHEANGLPAAVEREILTDWSGALNLFRLGDDWKVYFGLAAKQLGGNDWVI